MARDIKNRYTPIVQNVDQNVQAYMANMGYKNISVPPGITIENTQQQPQQVINPQQVQPQQFVQQPQQQIIQQPIQIQPNITPNSGNQVIEPGNVINIQGVQPVDSNPQQQVPVNQQSAVGRGSPYTIMNQQKNQQDSQQPQNQQQPTQVNPQEQQELSTQFVVDESGNLQQINPNVQDPNQQQVNQQLPQQPQVQQPDINQFVQPPQNVPDTNPQMTNLMQQNQLLQNAILEMKNGNGNGNVANQQTQTPKQTPKLQDFVKDLGEDWNPDEALKPNTKSGIAYNSYMDARDTFRDETYQNQVTNLITEREQSNQALIKAEAFAKQNPQFQNSLTGKADIPKIKSWLEGAVDGDWNVLFNALNIRQNPQLLNSQPQQMQNQPVQYVQPQYNSEVQPQQSAQQHQGMVLPNQVNAAANQISPIANVGGGSNVQNAVQPVPDSVKILQSTYGKNFKLPPGAQIDNTKYFNTK